MQLLVANTFNMELLRLKKVEKTVGGEVQITGSKSETNRLLILKQFFPNLTIENTSNSDDSVLMTNALSSISEEINIGHAGTAMRFLTSYFAVKEKSHFPALPNFADPAEAAIAWANEYKAKQQALADAEYFKATKSEIGSRREATAMGRLSAKVKEVESLKVQLDKSLDFASIKSVEIATGRKFGWHALKKWSKSNSSEIKTIPDPNFGEVKTYHKDAWLAVYNINLSSIRGA